MILIHIENNYDGVIKVALMETFWVLNKEKNMDLG